MILLSKRGYSLLFITVFLLLITGSCDNGLSPTSEVASEPITLQSIPRYGEPAGKAKSVSDSPDYFTCVVSTLLPEEATNKYRYNSYKIQIPNSLINKKDTIQWQTFVYGSQKAPSHAKQVFGYGGVVRIARCRIPDNSHIVNWLHEQFKKYGADSWLSAYQQDPQANDTSSVDRTHSKWVCDYWWVTEVCQGDGNGGTVEGTCVTTQVECVSSHYEIEGSGGGGLGGGGGDRGPSSDPCEPCDDSTMRCDLGGGDGQVPIGCQVDPPPPPINPCEYVNPPEYCSQEPCDTNGEYPVLGNADVQNAMDDAWLESYGSEDNPLPHGQRNEAMFMVLATIDGYVIEEIPPGPETSSCHFDFDGANITSNIAALIHIHPYSDGDDPDDPRCKSGFYNADDVSVGDEAIVQFISNSTILPDTPMYVMDKDKIRVIQPSNPSQYSETINRCGY